MSRFFIENTPGSPAGLRVRTRGVQVSDFRRLIVFVPSGLLGRAGAFLQAGNHQWPVTNFKNMVIIS